MMQTFDRRTRALVAATVAATLAACGSPNTLPIANSASPALRAHAASGSASATITCVTGSLEASYSYACSGSGLNSPYAATVDKHGNVWIADSGNNAIKRVTPAGAIECITGTLAGSGGCGSTAFQQTDGVAVNGRGDIFVSSGSSALFEVKPPLRSPWKVKQIASNFQFAAPNRVALDSAGNLYVADGDANAVYRVSPAGAVSCVRGHGSGCSGSGFSNPQGVAVDGAGNIYVANAGSNSVVRISHGHVKTIGSGFDQPNGVAVDSLCLKQCYVYVADTYNNQVKQIAPNNATTVVAGPQFCGAGTCLFQGPTDVAVQYGCNGPTCALYVVDTGNYSVKKVTR